jgi:hypothetical protein
MTTLRRATEPAGCPPELAKMGPEDLRKALAKSLARTASELIRLAWIVRLLEEQGEDLDDLKLDLLPYLRLIAHGQLCPELLVRYGQSSALMRAARGLPMPDQERLATGESLPLAVLRPDGNLDCQLVDPALLTPAQARLVFAPGRIRPVDEQAILLRNPPPSRARPKSQVVGRARVGPFRDGIIAGGHFIPKADLVAALAAMAVPAPPEGPDDDDHDRRGKRVVALNLTDAQYARLKAAADAGDTKMASLLRRALAAYGLI